ncbi:hypothetical protein ACTOVL_00425 [Arcanobacterium canis]
MNEYSGHFIVTLLANPWRVPIVQVVYEESSCDTLRFYSRGTGATLSLAHSIHRAFTECVQLIDSLKVDKNSDSMLDMRNLWSSGKARKIFPQFFSKNPATSADILKYEKISFQQIFQNIIQANKSIYVAPIITTASFSVVKTLISGIGVSDGDYFANKAIDTFAQTMNLPSDRSEYTGPLFM